MKIILRLTLALIILAIAFLLFAPAAIEKAQNRVLAHAPWPVSAQAAALHASLLVGDWHADSTLWQRDLTVRADYGQVDIPRLQSGNVAIQMFTTVTKSPSGQNYSRNSSDAADNITLLALSQAWPPRTWTSLTERALYQAERLHAFAAKKPDDMRVVYSAQDLRDVLQARQSGSQQIAALLGTEGSHALDGKLENIQRLFDAGFRMMSLQHFFDNKLGGSLHGTSGKGLSDFGRQAVEAINALGIILDVSHSSEATVRDALALSTRPLVVSHTGLKGYCDTKRNISDQLMQEIAAKGGLIAIGYWDAAVCDITPKSVAAAIAYGIDLVGAQHIALGSDFDGSVSTHFDTSELAAITHELLVQGVSEADIRRVMGANMQAFLLRQL